MTRTPAISVSLMVLLCLAIAGQVFAQIQATVGVQQGNIFKYEVEGFWSTTNSSATVPTSWAELNQTEYYQATISSVTGTTVSIKTVQHFINGSDVNRDELIDVGIGIGGSVLVYASNLNLGNPLYPSSSLPWTINETVQRPYGSGYRATNHIEVTMTNLEGYIYRSASLYFDRTTGMLVDAYFEDVLTDTPDQTFSRNIKITESNVWTVPGTPSDGNGGNGGNGGNNPSGLPLEWIIAIVVVVAVVVAVASVLLLRTRKKKYRPYRR